MTDDRYSQVIKISSSDGKNHVDKFIHETSKRADKAQVEYGLDIRVERLDMSELEEPEEFE